MPPPSWVVLKFGGTSVSAPESWATIAALARGHLARGRRVALVCSALAGVSDLLANAVQAARRGRRADQILTQVAARHADFGAQLGIRAGAPVRRRLRRVHERLRAARRDRCVRPETAARVMATGELLLTRLGARWLRRQGLAAVWRDARRALVAAPVPDGEHRPEAWLAARLAVPQAEGPAPAWDAQPARLVITQGFIAGDGRGGTLLLGRGGSDTAAAHLAARLGALRLEIWTDVPGVFTANPHAVPQARQVRQLEYDEAETAAALGAKVLHPGTIAPLRARGVPLEVRWTARPGLHGTLVDATAPPGLKTLTVRDGLCLVRLRRPPAWQPVGVMADFAACFRHHGLSMDLVSSSPDDLRATVDLKANPGARERLGALVRDLRRYGHPAVRHGLASLSFVGRDVAREVGLLEPLARAEGIRRVHMITHAANGLHANLVVPEGDAAVLLRQAHHAHFEARRRAGPFGPCWSELCEPTPRRAGATP